MSERGERIADLQRQADERLLQTIAVSKHVPHGGAGQQLRCQSCARCYRVVGQGSWQIPSVIPNCPYCGASYKEEDQH